MTGATHGTMTERTYRYIRARLATGQFQAGSQLSETAIAQAVGVGRTPVREAFLLLENEGFIEQVPRYGTFVKRADRHERQALYELRETLEAYAAGKAAEYITDAALARLEQLCDEMHAAVRTIQQNKGVATESAVATIAVADMAFHMMILKASGNPFAIKQVSDTHLMSRIWGCDGGDPFQSELRGWAQSWGEHVRIYRAIRRRDRQAAAQHMAFHLRHATATAMARYDQQCRTEGAANVGYEWPGEVREAITRYAEFGPDAAV